MIKNNNKQRSEKWANPIYIYIAKGTPVILNVDNEVDGEALEKLGAIRMPESMADEIFGENAEYADNTTCIITQNPDNPDFPFNVQFDSSKIPAKPQTQRKLTDSYISKLGLPQTTKCINISLKFVPETSITTAHYTANFTAPASGWLFISGSTVSGDNRVYASCFITEGKKGGYGMSSSFAASTGYCASLVPAIKGVGYYLRIQHCDNISARFIYAEGEI
ncbi:MAG: hypothetical protein K2I05_08960 [Mailhella sp.]|nr:hypothetical protein [Mailhella sp.]